MSNRPTFCPECLAANIMATVEGPTCQHVSRPGVKWFPENWDPPIDSRAAGHVSNPTHARVRWLERSPPRPLVLS